MYREGLASLPGRVESMPPSSSRPTGGTAGTDPPSECAAGPHEWYAASLRPLARAAREGRVSPLRAARLEQTMAELVPSPLCGGLAEPAGREDPAAQRKVGSR
jgi:hypothetical protein